MTEKQIKEVLSFMNDLRVSIMNAEESLDRVLEVFDDVEASDFAGPHVSPGDGFERCMAEVFGHEGGLSDRPLSEDPGGLTNMGVTIGTYMEWLRFKGEDSSMRFAREALVDITREEATEIYRRLYWDKVMGDDLPAGIDLMVFDAAVNSGPAQSARWLQRGLSVADDGIVGPQTLKALGLYQSYVVLVDSLYHQRLDFMQRLSNWEANKNGWLRRIDNVRATAKGWIAA